MHPPSPSLPPSHPAGGEDSEVRERDEIRHDRRKERQHDRNISRAAPDKRCWTRTLNTPHVNSLTPPFRIHTHSHTDALLTAESFMGPAVILNKRSRIQQSTQAAVLVCNDPQTVCVCGMCYQCVFCVKRVCVCVRTVRLSVDGIVAPWRSGGSGIQRRAHYNHNSSCQKAQNLVTLKLPLT